MRIKVGIAILCGVLVAGCGGGSSDEAVTTAAPDPPETTAPESTTTAAPTTTTTTTTTLPETTTTAAPSLTARGLIWNSSDPDLINAFDDQPTGDYDGIASVIDSVLVLDADEHESCREQAVMYQEFHGGDLADQCLAVSWRFSVADDFRVNENAPSGGIFVSRVVTPDQQRIVWLSSARGLPGSVDNVEVVTFPFGGAGSTVGWEIGSDLVGWSEQTYTVPVELPLVVLE